MDGSGTLLAVAEALCKASFFHPPARVSQLPQNCKKTRKAEDFFLRGLPFFSRSAVHRRNTLYPRWHIDLTEWEADQMAFSMKI